MPCRDMSACDFEGFLQREGARVQRFAENRGVHAQFGELLDVAQVVELGDATGCGDLRVGADATSRSSSMFGPLIMPSRATSVTT